MYKAPNGKLIKIHLDYDSKSNTIDSITIAGDFFAYPEESIQDLERILQGAVLEKDTLFDVIFHFVKENKVEFIGITPESITEAVMRCPL